MGLNLSSGALVQAVAGGVLLVSVLITFCGIVAFCNRSSRRRAMTIGFSGGEKPAERIVPELVDVVLNSSTNSFYDWKDISPISAKFTPWTSDEWISNSTNGVVGTDASTSPPSAANGSRRAVEVIVIIAMPSSETRESYEPTPDVALGRAEAFWRDPASSP